jgi:hypothetical protein
VVSLPDFARGPDAVHRINLPNNVSPALGIPIALSNGSGVTDGTFVLQYNANLLTITGGTVNSTLSGATFTVTPSGSGTSAQATIVFHSPTALAAGAVQLGGLTATVPANAPYKSKQVLHFSSLSLNGGAIAAVGDDGVQAVAFFGDATGDGTYTSADSVLITQVSSGSDTGFAAFPVLDPLIVGDLNGDGRIRAADATLLNLYLNGGAVSQIPTYPGAPSNNPAGPDPALSIPADLPVSAGGVIRVPVLIDDPRPEDSSGLTQALLALTYDPALLSVSAPDIHLGTVPASGIGWAVQSRIDSASGQMGIVLFSGTPISTSDGGSLVTIDFHVQPGALAAPAVQLVATVNPGGHGEIHTALDDVQGPLTLHPLQGADSVAPPTHPQLPPQQPAPISSAPDQHLAGGPDLPRTNDRDGPLPPDFRVWDLPVSAAAPVITDEPAGAGVAEGIAPIGDPTEVSNDPPEMGGKRASFEALVVAVPDVQALDALSLAELDRVFVSPAVALADGFEDSV